MKFVAGDPTDVALCVALKHEFLRCEDAFNDFAASAIISIQRGSDRRFAYKAYNDYARFLVHLYEFMIGAIARDRGNTAKLNFELADQYIASETQRSLTNRREAILGGRAPAWENDISYYPEKVPPGFATEWRECRNSVGVHVSLKRSHFNLSDFYKRNHKYIGLLYSDAQSWWGLSGREFPDLAEITVFSVNLQEDPPRQEY